jgi:hypothetical protein
MIVIEKKWNSLLQAHELTYLADTADDLVVNDLDPDCAAGSVILVIDTKEAYMKNTQGQWQKLGATEVIA